MNYSVRHFRSNYNPWKHGERSGAVTVVSNIVRDAHNKPIALEFGVAFCSPREKAFVKKRGVELARERLAWRDPKFYRSIPLSANRKLRYWEIDQLIHTVIATTMDRPRWTNSVF